MKDEVRSTATNLNEKCTQSVPERSTSACADSSLEYFKRKGQSQELFASKD